MSRVVHFEIPAVDGKKSVEFYKEVFGWEASQFGPNEYWLVNTGDEREPGINGAIMTRKDPAQPVVCTIGVNDLNFSEKAVVQFGGTIVVPRNVIPGVGYTLYFKDPDGNIFGLFQSDPNAK